MMKLLSSRKQKADLPGVELRQLTLQHRLLIPPGFSFKMGQWNRGTIMNHDDLMGWMGY
jgi:hypothetical protein